MKVENKTFAEDKKPSNLTSLEINYKEKVTLVSDFV